MKILLTGAGGQFGRAIQASASENDLIPLSHVDLDITDLEAVRRAVDHHSPGVVINAAAWTNVDGAETDQEGAYRLNALGPQNLALATGALNIPIVHISTDYVFDGAAERPYHEFDEPDPQTVYGRSKLAGERAVSAHNPRHYIVRTAWLYHIEGRNFPRTMIGLSGRDEVRVVSDQYGSPTWAPHLARAVFELIRTEAFGVWHLAGAGVASWYELTLALFELAGIRTQVVPVATADFPRPARRPRFSALTSLREPRITLPPWREGLKEFVKELSSKGFASDPTPPLVA